MADKPSWPPPGPWQTIPGIARLVEKSAKSKALSPKTKRYCEDPARDDLGRFAGCNSGGGGGGSSSDSGGSEGESSGASSSTTSGGVQPITADEARGDSRPVSAEEFQALAQQGQQELGSMAADASDPTGLDKNWGSIQQDAYQQTQQSWGGATYDAHTGQAFTTSDNVYAMSVKPPGVDSVSVPENATVDQFNAAMDQARATFSDQLSYRGGALGVFHDDELQRIDIDPVITVNSLSQVESIGAATHAIGGAYNFADGNGYWPPHVGAPAMAGARSMNDVRRELRFPGLPAHRYLQRKKGKDKAKPGKQAVVVFDFDETITKAPGMCAHLSSALRAAGDHVVVLTGNASPRADLVKRLAAYGFQFDDLVQYQDSESDGLIRAEHLKQFGATFAVDNRIDRSPTYAKVCPHLFVVAEPPKPADDEAKGTEKIAKAAAKKIGLRERPARMERRGPPRIPTNYNPNGGTPETRCGNCDMFWQGMCWGFGDVRVDPVHGKCDEWTPEEDTPGG